MNISQLYIPLFVQTLFRGQASVQWYQESYHLSAGAALLPGSWLHWELEPADRFSAPVECCTLIHLELALCLIIRSSDCLSILPSVISSSWVFICRSRGTKHILHVSSQAVDTAAAPEP